MTSFINPYNFIPVNEYAERGQLEHGTLTGYISYKLTTGSSLFIPNTSSDHAFDVKKTSDGNGTPDDPNNEHRTYDFHSLNTLEKNKSYNDCYFEPRIPGSEVRGVIRSIYETLTNSCIPVINDDVIIGKRTVEQFKAGVLKRNAAGQVELFEAEDVIYREEIGRGRYKKAFYSESIPADGSEVNIETTSTKRGKKRVTAFLSSGGKRGYLICGEEGPEMDSKKEEKHNAHVFLAKDNKRVCDIGTDDMNRLKTVIRQYQENNSEAYKSYSKLLDAFNKGETSGIAVYYSNISSKNKRLLFLSPACITREVYVNKVSAAAKGYNACKPATDKDKLCPACALFGLINSDGFSKGSQVRFTDLTLSGWNGDNYKDCYDEGLYIMPELSGPKLANTEFYLKKPVVPEGEVWFWTYDYYTVRTADGDVIVKTYEPTISGRKFYWHGRKVEGYRHRNGRNKTVRTVKKGISFEGRLYFENITQKQLNQLKCIMDYTSDGRHGFKMGNGKPVGLGTVCINVENVFIRKFEGGQYLNESLDLGHFTLGDIGCDKKTEKAFECMTELLSESDAKQVCYPGVFNEGDEGFKWFAANKRAYRIQRKCGTEYVTDKVTKSPQKRIQVKLEQSIGSVAGGSIPKLQTVTDKRNEDAGNGTARIGTGAPECKYPGCHNEVKKNRKTGKWYNYCPEHRIKEGK